jgi:voltage-gated potassium channel
MPTWWRITGGTERIMWSSLKSMVDDHESPPGRVFDLCIQILIVASLVTFSIETLPDLSKATRTWLHLFEVVVVLFFTVEYLLRVAAAQRPLRFVFSFFGLVDMLAILPFYLTVGLDLRAVRIVRLFRLVRIFKLLRYSKAVERFRVAFSTVREELFLFFVATIFLIYVSGVGIYYFESSAQPEVFKSVFHSLWWAVATLTTVGYGDTYPVTAGGKIFTFFILMFGLGIIAVPTGLIASALTRAIEAEQGVARRQGEHERERELP